MSHVFDLNAFFLSSLSLGVNVKMISQTEGKSHKIKYTIFIFYSSFWSVYELLTFSLFVSYSATFSTHSY